MMMAPTAIPTGNDDPRKLRELLQKASNLAAHYRLSTVMVGMSGNEGDLLFPEMVNYVGSALRVDDAIFRMTRERAVFMLTDADRPRAEEIMQRLILGFHESFSPAKEPRIALEFFEVTPDTPDVTVRDVLPSLFRNGSASH